MELVTGIRLSDFRSLATVDVSALPDLVPIVGVNGPGKSNLLRALNVFFNGVVEEGDPLNLRRDFRDPSRKTKKRIGIEVDLIYDFELRSEYVDALGQLAEGSTSFTIRKTYTIDPITSLVATEIATGRTAEELRILAPEEHGLVVRLLNAVRFRYIPNHIHPTMLLRREEETIRRLLFDRMGKSKAIG